MKKLAGLSGLAAAFVLVAAAPVAANNPNSDVTYDQIAKQAKNIEGEPVTISTNFFLGWTGAWDTVVLRSAELWKKWLPTGSKVEWKRNLQGPPVITDLIAGKQQIGYLGDNPAIVSTAKAALAPISIVALNLVSSGRMCGTILVRSDAPEFKSYREAIAWLDGKIVGVPKGSCADRLGQLMLQKEGVKVQWQQMQGEVIVTSLQAKRIDAAIMYEPHLSKSVFDDHARWAASPAVFGELDADAIVMREDFIKKNPDVVVAWLKANIEALYFLRDKPIETVEFLKKELPDYSRENLWYALYGAQPESIGASGPVVRGKMIIDADGRSLLERGYQFLLDHKIVRDPKMRDGAVRTEYVTRAFEELGLDPNQQLFEIPAGLTNPFKGDELVEGGK